MQALNGGWGSRVLNWFPVQVILFGGACSKVTDQIVKAAKHWSLVQVNVLLMMIPYRRQAWSLIYRSASKKPTEAEDKAHVASKLCSL